MLQWPTRTARVRSTSFPTAVASLLCPPGCHPTCCGRASSPSPTTVASLWQRSKGTITCERSRERHVERWSAGGEGGGIKLG